MQSNNYRRMILGRTEELGLTTFLAGLLIGGLAGATVMLFVSPASGREVRGQLRQKGLELRDRVAETAEEARHRAGDFATQARTRANEVAQQISDEARLRFERV